MALTPSDLKQCASTTMPTSQASVNIGGAMNTSALIDLSSIGQVFPSIGAAPAGGTARVLTAKTFLLNSSTTNDLVGGVIWGSNFIDDAPPSPSASTVTIQPDSALDDSSYKTRVIGFDASGSPLQEEVVMGGTSAVTTTQQFLPPVASVESRDTTSGALKSTHGNWAISQGSSGTGTLPAGAQSAQSEVKFGLGATLSDSSTATSATSLPAGQTVGKARTQATGLAVANSGTLTKGLGQPIWWQLTLAPGRKPSTDMQALLGWAGQTGD